MSIVSKTVIKGVLVAVLVAVVVAALVMVAFVMAVVVAVVAAADDVADNAAGGMAVALAVVVVLDVAIAAADVFGAAATNPQPQSVGASLIVFLFASCAAISSCRFASLFEHTKLFESRPDDSIHIPDD